MVEKVKYIEVGFSNSCELYAPMEIILSKLNKLRFEQVIIYRHYIDINERFKECKISGYEANEKIKYINSQLHSIADQIKLLELEKDEAIFRKLKNKNFKNAKCMKRNINGFNIKTFRQMTIDLYKNKLPKFCNHCGSKKNLTIHHIRYKYPIVEEDLVRLCRNCHSKEEQFIKQQNKKIVTMGLSI